MRHQTLGQTDTHFFNGTLGDVGIFRSRHKTREQVKTRHAMFSEWNKTKREIIIFIPG